MSFERLHRIALINPKRPLWTTNPRLSPIFHRLESRLRPWYSPPLSLLTIAAMIPLEIEVELIDEDFDKIDFERHYDLVGITAMTQQVLRAYEIAAEFRSRGIPVVLGGMHASVMSDEALNNVDSVVVGEAELLWPRCLHDYNSKQPQRIYTHPTNIWPDISASPVPRYELLNKKILSRGAGYYNMVPIQATRGCPHRCIFCAVTKVNGPVIRTKSVDQILHELNALRSAVESPLIMFADDNLFVNKQYARQLLKALLKCGGVRWVAQSDISIADDPNLLSLAYASGCVGFLIGLESLNEQSLVAVNDNRWKSKRLVEYSAAVQRIQEKGLVVHAAFVVGFDHDDTGTFERIRNFMVENHCGGQITILTPIPGSRLYYQLNAQGRLLRPEFWDQCNFFDVTYHPKLLSLTELEEGLAWLYQEVFGDSVYQTRVDYMKAIYRKLPSRKMVGGSLIDNN